jgi:hypothetical protein
MDGASGASSGNEFMRNSTQVRSSHYVACPSAVEIDPIADLPQALDVH